MVTIDDLAERGDELHAVPLMMPSDLETIDRAARWTTPGHWTKGNPGDAIVTNAPLPIPGPFGQEVQIHYGGYVVAESVDPADQEFIINAHNEWIPGLVATLRVAWWVLDHLLHCPDCNGSGTHHEPDAHGTTRAVECPWRRRARILLNQEEQP